MCGAQRERGRNGGAKDGGCGCRPVATARAMYEVGAETSRCAGRAASAIGADAGGGCGGEQVWAVRGQCREAKAQKP